MVKILKKIIFLKKYKKLKIMSNRNKTLALFLKKLDFKYINKIAIILSFFIVKK